MSELFNLKTQQLIFKGYCKGFPKGKNNPKANRGDGSAVTTWEQVKDLATFGAVCKQTIVDVSFDNVDTEDTELSERVVEILDKLGVDTYMLVSPHGLHTFWKIPKGMKIKDGICLLACGIPSDVHHGKTYIPLMCDGIPRDEFWEDSTFEAIPELPTALYPVKTLSVEERTSRGLWELSAGDGRNDALSKHAFCCRYAGLSKDTIIDIFSNITNNLVFKDALPSAEINVILRDETFEKIDDNLFYEDGKFRHDLMGNHLISKNNIISINGKLHMYNGAYYEASPRDKAIERCCLELVSNLTQHNRNEVLSYVELYASDVSISKADYITFANGIYYIKADKLLEFTPEIIDVAQIPWNYNPDAYDETVDTVLNNLTCNNEKVRMLLEEAVGYCFYRRNELAAAFFIDGQGSNGKSTFYKMLNCMLGQKNVSDLDIAQIGKNFLTINLYEKLANIGDDITKCRLASNELASFKKLVTGDTMTVDVKNKDAFTFSNYAKMFFACNGMPNLTSDPAVMRRIKIIPFRAKFTPGSVNFDNTISDKLTTQSAMEYLVKLGIDGLKRVLKNRDFTNCDEVLEAMKEYEKNVDSGIAFVEETGIEDILNKSYDDVRVLYQKFVDDNGIRYPQSLKTVSMTLKNKYGVVLKTARINGKVLKTYVRAESV